MKKLLIGPILLAVILFSIVTPIPANAAQCDGLIKALEHIPPHSPAYAKIIEKAQNNECTEALDLAALTAFYYSTNGDGWEFNTGWLTDTPYCEWYGITCYGAGSANEGQVKILNMGANNLSGSIPPEIDNLTNLQELWLQKNNLSGSIPPEIGNLTNLQGLYLTTNQLNGSIPSEIGNLVNLQKLYLNNNPLLEGSIPPEIGNLANLQELSLAGNNLSGSIPPEIGNLVLLWRLRLSHNQLSEPIPLEISNLTNLHELLLSENDPSLCLPVALQAWYDSLYRASPTSESILCAQ